MVPKRCKPRSEHDRQFREWHAQGIVRKLSREDRQRFLRRDWFSPSQCLHDIIAQHDVAAMFEEIQLHDTTAVAVMEMSSRVLARCRFRSLPVELSYRCRRDELIEGSWAEPLRSPAFLLLDSTKRLGGFDDRNALVLLEVEQISVSRDDEIDVGTDRAGKNVIVVGVNRDR